MPVTLLRLEKVKKCRIKPSFELARIRTWNLLIRSQTRYPLRHKPLVKPIGRVPLTHFKKARHSLGASDAISYLFVYGARAKPFEASKQSGAVEACWAHNPEVRGSKPRSAKIITLKISHIILHYNMFNLHHSCSSTAS